MFCDYKRARNPKDFYLECREKNFVVIQIRSQQSENGIKKNVFLTRRTGLSPSQEEVKIQIKPEKDVSVEESEENKIMKTIGLELEELDNKEKEKEEVKINEEEVAYTDDEGSDDSQIIKVAKRHSNKETRKLKRGRWNSTTAHGKNVRHSNNLSESFNFKHLVSQKQMNRINKSRANSPALGDEDDEDNIVKVSEDYDGIWEEEEEEPDTEGLGLLEGNLELKSNWQELKFNKDEEISRIRFVVKKEMDCFIEGLVLKDVRVEHINTQYEKGDNFFIISNGNVFFVNVEKEYTIRQVYEDNGEKPLRDVVCFSSYYMRDTIKVFMKYLDFNASFGEIKKMKLNIKKTNKKTRSRVIFVPTFSCPWSSGFDVFKVVIYRERALLFALEIVTGNCELLEVSRIQAAEYSVIWNSIIKNIRDVSFRNLYSNIIGVFLIRKFDNLIKYALEIRQINVKKGILGNTIKIVEDILFYRFYQLKLSQSDENRLKKLKDNQKFLVPLKMKNRLGFSSAVSHNSNEMRIVFFNKLNKEILKDQEQKDVYFKLNTTALKRRSKIYSILNDEKMDTILKYRKVQGIIDSIKPRIIAKNSIKVKEQRKKISIYFRKKRDFLNDSQFDNHIIKTFVDDLSSTLFESSGNKQFFQVSETILDSYFDIYSTFYCCYFTNFEIEDIVKVDEENPFLFWLNVLTCGMVMFILKIMINCFCIRTKNSKDRSFNFFREQQITLKNELEKRKKFCISEEKNAEFDALINKIQYLPYTQLLNLFMYWNGFISCFNITFGCLCYTPHCFRKGKEWLNKYVLSIIFSMTISVVGSLFVYVFVNFIFTYTFFTCEGTPWSGSPSCSRHGYCSSPGFFRPSSCVCNPGYWGVDCSQTYCYNITSDEDNVCSGHGFCLEFNDCRCDLGWSGIDCSVPSRRDFNT